MKRKLVPAGCHTATCTIAHIQRRWSQGNWEHFQQRAQDRQGLYAGAETGSWRTNVHRERHMVQNNYTHKTVLADMERYQAAFCGGEEVMKNSDNVVPWYLKESQEEVKRARREAYIKHKKEMEKGLRAEEAKYQKRLQLKERMMETGKLANQVGDHRALHQMERVYDSEDQTISKSPMVSRDGHSSDPQSGGATGGGKAFGVGSTDAPDGSSRMAEVHVDEEDEDEFVFVNGMRKRRVHYEREVALKQEEEQYRQTQFQQQQQQQQRFRWEAPSMPHRTSGAPEGVATTPSATAESTEPTPGVGIRVAFGGQHHPQQVAQSATMEDQPIQQRPAATMGEGRSGGSGVGQEEASSDSKSTRQSKLKSAFFKPKTVTQY